MGIDSHMLWLISIGNNTIITFNDTILTHDASTNKAGLGTIIGLIRIGENCFIGAGSTKLCGISIGETMLSLALVL